MRPGSRGAFTDGALTPERSFPGFKSSGDEPYAEERDSGQHRPSLASPPPDKGTPVARRVRKARGLPSGDGPATEGDESDDTREPPILGMGSLAGQTPGRSVPASERDR